MTIEVLDTVGAIFLIVVSIQIATAWCNILMGQNIDEFDKFSAIRQYFSYQNFPFS